MDLSFVIFIVDGLVDFNSFARYGSNVGPSKSKIKDEREEKKEKRKSSLLEGLNLLFPRIKGNKLKGRERSLNQIQVVLSMMDHIIQGNA
jgi:hypothetical protein